MAKTTNKPRRADNEAIAKARYIKGSERKLNLLAEMIRGKLAARALIDLEFSRKRMSLEVKKVLESAIANAENNHNLDVDRLVVKSATVGRTMTMKRFHARGRGRSAGVEKPFSNITIVVGEGGAEKHKTKKAAAEAKVKEGAKKKASAKKSAGKTAKTETKAGE
ncbi:MAG: 50S ribosomal protein L22 [Alphaproteobacteria bacterium]|nr:50S ribosomal protein L22 [Alphaproteobacteria bacterium]MDE2335827.1 50S ribosomal protein L22 [Alphaproteobacteria bacterium]